MALKKQQKKGAAQKRAVWASALEEVQLRGNKAKRANVLEVYDRLTRRKLGRLRDGGKFGNLFNVLLSPQPDLDPNSRGKKGGVGGGGRRTPAAAKTT